MICRLLKPAVKASAGRAPFWNVRHGAKAPAQDMEALYGLKLVSSENFQELSG